MTPRLLGVREELPPSLVAHVALEGHLVRVRVRVRVRVGVRVGVRVRVRVGVGVRVRVRVHLASTAAASSGFWLAFLCRFPSLLRKACLLDKVCPDLLTQVPCSCRLVAISLQCRMCSYSP